MNVLYCNCFNALNFFIQAQKTTFYNPIICQGTHTEKRRFVIENKATDPLVFGTAKFAFLYSILQPVIQLIIKKFEYLRSILRTGVCLNKQYPAILKGPDIRAYGLYQAFLMNIPVQPGVLLSQGIAGQLNCVVIVVIDIYRWHGNEHNLLV